MSFFDFFASLARSRADLVRRRTANAMSPINWFVGLTTPACFGAVCVLPGNDPLRPWLLGIGCLPILLGFGIAIYFAGWKTDRLQTEEHLTQMKTLDIISTKSNKVAINPVDLPAISNPHPQEDSEAEDEGSR